MGSGSGVGVPGIVWLRHRRTRLAHAFEENGSWSFCLKMEAHDSDPYKPIDQCRMCQKFVERIEKREKIR